MLNIIEPRYEISKCFEKKISLPVLFLPLYSKQNSYTIGQNVLYSASIPALR